MARNGIMAASAYQQNGGYQRSSRRMAHGGENINLKMANENQRSNIAIMAAEENNMA